MFCGYYKYFYSDLKKYFDIVIPLKARNQINSIVITFSIIKVFLINIIIY